MFLCFSSRRKIRRNIKCGKPKLNSFKTIPLNMAGHSDNNLVGRSYKQNFINYFWIKLGSKYSSLNDLSDVRLFLNEYLNEKKFILIRIQVFVGDTEQNQAKRKCFPRPFKYE